MNKHTSSVSLIDGHTEDRTDAEIIKALECLAYHKECPESEECQYYMDNRNICDNVSLAKDALGLINRLQAKNKELDEKLIIQKRLNRYTTGRD